MEETQREEDMMLVSLKEQRRSLKEGLQRTQQLTLSMLSILASFDQRLSALSPPHQGEEHDRLRSNLLEEISSTAHTKQIDNDEILLHTHNIRKAHENIDKTLKATKAIMEHYEVCRQVETKVADDPATDFDNYIRRVDRLQEAINFFKSNRWLKGSDETLHHAENLLIKSMAKLEDFFRHTLTENRFRLFNQNVEELSHRQVQWTVHDSQLKKALQKAVVESVVPTYGLFLKGFSANFEGSKNPKKYIKYTVQDLEHLLADLFEGKVVL